MIGSHRSLPCGVYCISLARSTARRRHMERQFDRLGWRTVFIDAVEGADLDLEAMQRTAELHPQNEGLVGPMSQGEVGCALSHAKVWRMLCESDRRYALVCEDDIVLPRALDLWTLLRWIPGDGDLVYLHYLNDQTLASIRPAFDPEKDTPVGTAGAFSIFDAWSCGGASCYLVSQRGARRLLENLRGVRYPSDGLLARLTASGQLRAYALWPRPVATHPFESTIR
jgi:glycosyl transferase, family 25